MPFIQLRGGAYQTRSLIAAAQRCLNLYPEPSPQAQAEPYLAAHYCTPGLTLQATWNHDICRGLYTASTGELWAVYDQQLLWFDSAGAWHQVGTLHPSDPSDATPRYTPVSMVDNGTILLLVDGSVDGWFCNVITHDGFARIDRTINTGFYGSDYASYQDTFFVLNKPGTPIFYCSQSEVGVNQLTTLYSVAAVSYNFATSAPFDDDVPIGYLAGDVLTLNDTGGAQVTVNTVDAQGHILTFGTTNGGAFSSTPAVPTGTTGGSGTGAAFDIVVQNNTGAFDPLDFASMTGQAGTCLAALSVHRVIWLLGTNSYEIWINNGGDGSAVNSFPFSIYPQAYGNWGCAAKYSIASVLNQIFWLSQDKFGHALVMHGKDMSAGRASTFAIEYQMSQYDRIDDAIGYAYQQQGHVFYVLTFPSAHSSRGATWVFDSSTNEWHERAYIDNNGIEYRHLSNACTSAYGKVYVGDWRNGNLYTFDPDNYTDNGQPIRRLRCFPHEVDLEANRRVMYLNAIVQMQVGTASQGGNARTVIDCDFDATDGTLLQDYSNVNNIGANFTKVGSLNGVILADRLTGASTGTALYEASGTPDTSDYTVQFEMVPDSYLLAAPNGNEVYVIARANISDNGYQAGISSNGTAYSVFLTVMGGATSTLTLGTLSSGYYQVNLQLIGASIQVSVLRSADLLWLSSTGSWVGSFVPAIDITDETYTTAGRILIGGVWT